MRQGTRCRARFSPAISHLPCREQTRTPEIDGKGDEAPDEAEPRTCPPAPRGEDREGQRGQETQEESPSRHQSNQLAHLVVTETQPEKSNQCEAGHPSGLPIRLRPPRVESQQRHLKGGK